MAEQATIRTKVELLHDMVTLQLADHRKRLEVMEETIIGSASRPGLLEKNRNLTKDLAKLFGIISTVGFIFFKILSPIYDSWMSKWIPQKIAVSESDQAPTSKVKLVHKPVAALDSPIKKQ